MTHRGQEDRLGAKLSPEFHRSRLEEIWQRCPDGLILLRGELDWFKKRELRSFDPAYTEPNFKQERHLYYLTGIEVPNSFVLIDPRRKEVHLYTDWENDRQLREAMEPGLVTAVHPTAAFLRDVRICGEGCDCLYTLYVPFPEDGGLVAKTRVMTGVFPPGMGEPVTEETQFARRLAKLFPSHRVKSLAPILAAMQRIKHPEEIRLLRKANRVAVKAILEAIRTIRPGCYDHEVAAAIQYAICGDGGARPTFPPNVMSGPNVFQSILHIWSDYHHLDRELAAGDAVYIDVGAEVNYYVSDIGRTFPVGGVFMPEQRRLYDLYLHCYLEALRSVRPGVTQAKLLETAVSAMRRQLPDLHEPYLQNAANGFIEMTSARPMLGHYVDMNVIGAGAGRDTALEPGMVFVIEPLLFCKEQQFGVFVEDTILVTDSGYEILSDGLPVTADDIEAVTRAA